MADPDLGTWTYAYPGDAGAPATSPVKPFWLVAKKTDPKNQAIAYQYDVLNRMTSKTGTNLSVRHGYDSVTNEIGRRTSISDGAGRATYAFDQWGRLTSLTRTISGPSYTLTMIYDAMDRVLSLTYPNGDVLSYIYGDHGMPVSALLKGPPLVTDTSYGPSAGVADLVHAQMTV